MEKKTGGPAFPCSQRITEKYMDEGGYGRSRTVIVPSEGMTLLDYFAAKAMEGVLASLSIEENPISKQIARFSYEVADAMIAERDKK